MTDHESTFSRPLMNLSSIAALFSFLFCMLASNVLLNNPLVGGGLYLMGRVAMMYGKWLHPFRSLDLSRQQKWILLSFLAVIILLALLLVMAVPIVLGSSQFLVVFAMTLLIVIRPNLVKWAMNRDQRPVRSFSLMLCVQAILLIFPAVFLFLMVPASTAWMLTLCCLISVIPETLGIWRTRYEDPSPSTLVKDMEVLTKLKDVHACRTYQRLLLITAAALQVTLIMTYTFIGCTAQEMLLIMCIAFFGTVLSYWVTDFIIKRVFRKSPDPLNVLLVGLVLWLSGLILFSVNILKISMLNAYLSLALCACGIGISVRVFALLDSNMRRVAAFALSGPVPPAYDRVMRFFVEIASLCGQLLALIGVTCICIFNLSAFPHTLEGLARSIQPLLVLPALALVAAAFVCALYFPVTKRRMSKVDKYIDLESKGEDNPALKEQLESVILRRSIKHYGVKLIIAIIRPFYYHKICGRENVPDEEDTVNVFVCNHGEIYGPIVANLFVPFSFRPWVISEMMDKESITRRTAEGTFSHIKWLPEKWAYKLAGTLAPLIVWGMKSVDAIPVYFQNPRKLISTFRESVTAMEAGDNILLFPENSDDTPEHRYKLTGVSHFFTGFTMLGPMYYNKTGKCANFVPIYANKQKRTLTFGKPTKFDPSNAPNDERDRLCDYLRGEMLRIAGVQEQEKQP